MLQIPERRTRTSAKPCRGRGRRTSRTTARPFPKTSARIARMLRAGEAQGFVNVCVSEDARYEAFPANATVTFQVFWPAGRSGSGMRTASLVT